MTQYRPWFASYPPGVPATLEPLPEKSLYSILEDAGWARGADGVRAKGSLRAKVELCTTDARLFRSSPGVTSCWY